MDDDIEYGYSRCVKEGRDPKNGWQRMIYSDEVFWKHVKNHEFMWYHNVAQFPFVDGYFLCKVLDDPVWGECHYPVAGPFPDLQSAKAAALILGVCKEHSQ